MKYIITESKLGSSIGKYLKMRFSYVKGVKYKTYPIKKYDGRILDKNVLEVVIDPYGVGEGNIDERWGHLGEFKKEIKEELNKTFKLGLYSYDTEWEVLVLGVRLELVV
jgi:hypothetical protein